MIRHHHNLMSTLGISISQVRRFQYYGEHDFGSIDHPVIGKIFWKIDYYADSACVFGSEDPSDPTKSYRVLTIMLVFEY